MKFSSAVSPYRTPFSENTWLKGFTAFFFLVWIQTLIGTTDVSNWLLENTLSFLFVGFLVFSHRKYQFSDLSSLLMCVYLCLHVYGSQFTYAENPFGYFLKNSFALSRNPYDRMVHFGFGFLLAYPMREIFLNWFPFPAWVAWSLPVEITLSVSGLY